ncbi:hypothetical protein GGH96_003328 [Coemansia sp. RSA 1972]|nr:hypothetical protein GGH96_003328 [Coemansia sp. RSA 1972]
MAEDSLATQAVDTTAGTMTGITAETVVETAVAAEETAVVETVEVAVVINCHKSWAIQAVATQSAPLREIIERSGNKPRLWDTLEPYLAAVVTETMVVTTEVIMVITEVMTEEVEVEVTVEVAAAAATEVEVEEEMVEVVAGANYQRKSATSVSVIF